MQRSYDLTKGNKSIKFSLDNDEKKFIQREFENYRSSIMSTDANPTIFRTIWSEHWTPKRSKNMKQTNSENYYHKLEKIRDSIQEYSKDNTVTDQQKFFTHSKEKNVKPLPEKFVSEALKLAKKFKSSLLNN